MTKPQGVAAAETAGSQLERSICETLDLRRRAAPLSGLLVSRDIDKTIVMHAMVVIAATGSVLVYLSIRSLSWEYAHDTPLLQYCGWLMVRHGRMPYRDFFETSMPGTFLFHEAVVAVFGTGNLAFMIVNDLLLALLLSISYLWMRHLSRSAALLFVCWHGAFYLASGTYNLLQRDWVAILPIATAFAVMAKSRGKPGSPPPGGLCSDDARSSARIRSHRPAARR